jgi:Glycosyl hydrolase family 71
MRESFQGVMQPRALLRGVTAFAALASAVLLATPHRAHAANPIPSLAYYYIWYDTTSWQRPKTTYPLLGRYSSDEVRVLRRHVALAQDAGLNGFIVSWKSTPKLNRRLAALVRIAAAADFKLAIIYQGLNFSRNPLPVERVASDIELFVRRFASAAPFSLEDKPVVIWSGTWKYTTAQVKWVAKRVRPYVLLLASEKSVSGYRRLDHFVDGDAYYWSSVDPERTPGYGDKLQDMSRAVHDSGGLWIAPAAPGFDARLIGGTRVVDRRDGKTLRQEWNTALASSPDAVGLISWNEFSESSAIEPTLAFGSQYLRLLKKIVGGKFTVEGDFDSSDTPPKQFGYAVPLFIGIGAVGVVGLAAFFWRRELRKASARATWSSPGSGT